MPSDSPWQIIALSLTLTLDGTEIPITAVSLDFELNTLPQATVTVPLGRDMQTLEPAPLQTQLDGGQVLKATINCAVVFAAGSDQSKAFGIPTDPFVLFSGYLAGTGYHRESEKSSLVLYLRHWLSDLDYSSVFSRSSQPTNPANYSLAAVLPTDGAGSESVYDGLYDYGNAITEANIQSDLWADALKPFVLALTKQDGLEIPEQGVRASPSDNSEAAASLAKIVAYPSLALNNTAVESVATLIRDHLEMALRNNIGLASHTLWDVIVGSIAPEYNFAIVPRITDALAVPFLPSLQQTFITITADEYVAADIQGSIPRPLRAVGLISGMYWGTGADGRPMSDASAGSRYVGGWYQNPAQQKGMILIANAPRWAEKLLGLSAADVPAAVGAGGKPVAVADAPGAAGVPNVGIRQKMADTATASANMLDNFAKARYAHELDRSKQGFVAGPFRLDIAPGSSVELQPDGFQQLNGSQFTSFYGSCARVSIALDAQSMTGGTSFHLTHVRTESENNSPGRTLTENPLYSSVYTGSGMLASPTPKGS